GEGRGGGGGTSWGRSGLGVPTLRLGGRSAMPRVRVSAVKPGLGTDSTTTLKLSMAAVPSLTLADGPKAWEKVGLPERSTFTRNVPAYEGRSVAVSESGLPATLAPTSAASRNGTIRTLTGCEATPEASAWNGPGLAIATLKRRPPSAFVVAAVTKVVPRSRRTRVPAVAGVSLPRKSTSCP